MLCSAPGWHGSWSCSLLRAPSWAGQRRSGPCGGQWGQGVPSGTVFCTGLGAACPAGARWEWGQSQAGAEGKLGVPSLCQLCWCHQAEGVVQSDTLVPWGGSARAFPAAAPAHPVPWMGQPLALPPLALPPLALQPECGRGGKQPLVRDGAVGCAGLPCSWAGARWAGARVGWGTLAVELLAVSGGVCQCLEAVGALRSATGKSRAR